MWSAILLFTKGCRFIYPWSTSLKFTFIEENIGKIRTPKVFLEKDCSSSFNSSPLFRPNSRMKTNVWSRKKPLIPIETNWHQVSISPTFYVQLLLMHILKAQKDSQVNQLFALLGSVGIKAACKHIDEIDPKIPLPSFLFFHFRSRQKVETFFNSSSILYRRLLRINTLYRVSQLVWCDTLSVTRHSRCDVIF